MPPLPALELLLSIFPLSHSFNFNPTTLGFTLDDHSWSIPIVRSTPQSLHAPPCAILHASACEASPLMPTCPKLVAGHVEPSLALLFPSWAPCSFSHLIFSAYFLSSDELFFFLIEKERITRRKKTEIKVDDKKASEGKEKIQKGSTTKPNKEPNATRPSNPF